ncbi:MAG: short-chain dehydrogenase [Pirellulaceae bacterium]|nr:MAG: short-chain dehydrogenase [Pirellulaceae bacterium]
MNATRHIVITGVSRGLGRALFEHYWQLGHKLSGCCRSSAVCQQLSSSFPERACLGVVDVSQEAEVGRWAAQALEAFGPPDLLINNAAVINANNVLWEVPVSEFSRLIDINVKGVFHVIRHFVPAMIERRNGVIVNISSGWGRSTSPQVAPYCASKFAVEGLTRALAAELPAGLAAVAVNPGVIHTEMLESCFGSMARSFPTAEAWVARAAPFFLALGPRHNGQSLDVPTA